MPSSNTAMLHVRIDPKLKKAAESILGRLGLNSAEAIRMYYAQIADKKAIPFDLSLEEGDRKENYTKVKNGAHLRKLIGLS